MGSTLLKFNQLELVDRKKNILVLFGGQSNSGTDPNTGRVDYSEMPTYLHF
jgi:hypothetical protein